MLFKRRASLDVKFKDSDKRIRIENMRISFSVAKTFTPTSNICDVRVYNLSQYTRGLFHELGDQITLNTGYESIEGEQILFVANTQRIYHQYNLPEIISSIEALDADLTFSLKYVNGSFSQTVSAVTVLKEVALQMGIEDISIPSNTPKFVYHQGRTFSDIASNELTTICDYLGLDWSIQNKTLLFAIKGKSIEEPPIELNAETGMIFFPELLKDLPLKNDLLTDQKSIGWRVRSILNPKIKPKGKVNIFSTKTPELNGIYTVQSVRHIGDTHANQWESVADVVRT